MTTNNAANNSSINESNKAQQFIGQQYRFPELISVGDLKKLPPPAWLIPGMIPEKAICEVHGAPATGKSLFVLDKAILIAKERSVIYVAAEGATGYKQRVEAWEEANNCKADNKLFFHKEPVNLFDKAEMAAFSNHIKSVSPALIVFDTLARCMTDGDENNAKDMTVITHNCIRIISELNTAVLLVHHTTKDGITERGSSALRGACDSMIEITKTDDVVTARSIKLKDGSPFKPLKFAIRNFKNSVALVQLTSATQPHRTTKGSNRE